MSRPPNNHPRLALVYIPENHNRVAHVHRMSWIPSYEVVVHCEFRSLHLVSVSGLECILIQPAPRAGLEERIQARYLTGLSSIHISTGALLIRAILFAVNDN